MGSQKNHKLPSWPTAAITAESPTWATDAEAMGTEAGTGSGFHVPVLMGRQKNHKLPSWPAATIAAESPTWATIIVGSCRVGT